MAPQRFRRLRRANLFFWRRKLAVENFSGYKLEPTLSILPTGDSGGPFFCRWRHPNHSDTFWHLKCYCVHVGRLFRTVGWRPCRTFQAAGRHFTCSGFENPRPNYLRRACQIINTPAVNELLRLPQAKQIFKKAGSEFHIQSKSGSTQWSQFCFPQFKQTPNPSFKTPTQPERRR